MRFTDYIWDFDGTLFDTYPLMAEGFHTALTQLGIPAKAEDVMREIKKSVGKCARYYAEGTSLTPEEIIARFQTVRRDIRDLPLYPGAKEVCMAIAANGGRNFLYSHRDESAWDALKDTGLMDAFSGGVISSDPFPGKPAPDALLHILGKYGIAPENALMLGDRDIDILAGRNAGIAGLLFDPDGFYTAFDTPLRASTFEELRTLCRIP